LAATIEGMGAVALADLEAGGNKKRWAYAKKIWLSRRRDLASE